MKKNLALFLCVVMMLSALFGCSGNATPAAPAAEAPKAEEPAPAEETKEEPAAAQATDLEANSIIRFTQTTMPKIDPGIGSDFAACTVLVNIYDPLVQPTHAGSVEPWIATSWSVAEDGLTWTFKIRDDVVFHSGNKLTAEDVAYSMNRILTMGTGFGYLFSSTVESAEATDATTLVIHCKKPSGTLLAALVRLYVLDSETVKAHYAAGDYGENQDYGQAFLLENDAGSGPYKVEEYKANNYIQGIMFDGYWGSFEENTPKRFKVYCSNEAVTVKTQMQREELECGDKYQSAETLAELDAMDGVDLILTNGGSVIYLLMNNQKAPTDDVHIRRALGYMMDYQTLIDYVYPGSKQAKSVVSSNLLGFKEIFDFSYNVEKAKEEIALSKYADTIADYPIEVCWVAETADREKMALLIQAVGSQIGLNIKVTKTPWTSVVANAATIAGTPNVTTTLASADYCEAGATLTSAFTSKEDGQGTWLNCSWLQDAELDAMIADATSTLDEAARVEKYQAIQDYLGERCVCVPLLEQAERFAYQSKYVEWNAAQPDQLIPVMGYVFYMRNIKIYPDKR